MFLSFITPTYNRKNLLQETLDSIFETKLDIEYEVIVVDDCSSDDTQMFIEAKYKEQIGNGLLKYIYLEKNLGVTGAKNYGTSIAKGKWIVFLDSDDLFIKESKYDFLKELSNNENCGVVFFRCKTFDGNLLGKEFEENVYYDLDKYMTLGFPGECLPVVRKEVALKFPYEQKLRGFEHIAYFRVLKNNITILVSRVIARKYRTDNEDRLSNFKGKMKRAKQFYDGYKTSLNEYKDIDYTVPNGLRIRVIAYFFLRFLAIFIRKR
jgi:teichuronic acid biosynthesis glycosyltransferase TuaG